jgi:hypothetical protein
MASTKTKLKGAQLFLARSRYGGFDSLEEQQAGNAAAVEEQISRGTRSPPGYGPQLPSPVPLPWKPAQGAPEAPSAAEAVARGITAPPYAKTSRISGRRLLLWRMSHGGNDPTSADEAQLVEEGDAQ